MLRAYCTLPEHKKLHLRSLRFFNKGMYVHETHNRLKEHRQNLGTMYPYLKY